MRNALDTLSLYASSGARLGLGLYAGGHARAPEQPVELFELEACPYCRMVRDAITALDIDAMIYPCPKQGTRYRPRVRELAGKEQFPFLHDPNTGVQMFESCDIVDYLYATYGTGMPPRGLRFTPTALLGAVVRNGRGHKARPSREPKQPLELYSFEASPYCKLVRERLCELELSYLLRSVGKGGSLDWIFPKIRARVIPNSVQTTARRQAFVDRSGRMQVPYLVDPNTGAELFESADILQYLDETYGEH